METIQISKPKIVKLIIDVEKEKVIVVWAKMTTTGIKVETGTFVFWKTLPAVEPVPTFWYELSSTNVTHVLNVIQMVENFISVNVD